MLVKKGKDLEFISCINRDGRGVTILDKRKDFMENEEFELIQLSISERTYLAIGFNIYVVRLAPNTNKY